MFAPKLYSVKKFSFSEIIRNNFIIEYNKKEERKYIIQQQDNQLFRQIRIITNNHDKYNTYIVFVDIHQGKNQSELLTKLILDGFFINGEHFVMSERSASMTRNGILSFVKEDIESELHERIGLGVKVDKVVLSKYVAYRGLSLSSSHCFENWYPKIIIVSDYEQIIPNQHIKYVVDKTTHYKDKETGEDKTWTQKDIIEGNKDIKINTFDGTGIHHPFITYRVQELLNSKTSPTSIMWRAPFIKGVTHEIDYTTFFKEHGITHITDVWGEKHSVEDVMIIMTESMYKGLKYFKQDGTINDWNRYWDLFKKYDHCLGVSKWNFSFEEEPIYTRGNYQILQDLNLPFEKFIKLAGYSIGWIEKIINGDKFFTYCFLGLTKEKHEAVNDYMQSILLHPDMLKEESVRQYLISLFKKYIDEMKSGKIHLKSTFRIATPDLIMFLEFLGREKLSIQGCLKSNEFYTKGIDGTYSGEYAIERNPHLAQSEHTILSATTNSQIERYCSHLSNICMINGKSLTMQRLSGMDYDGDLVLVIDNSIFLKGIKRNIPIVIDIDDKITALEEIYNKENVLKLVFRTINSLIGETSNCATCYYNKQAKTPEQRDKYLKYVDLLSIINGKNIDSSKTGVIFNIPKYIAKYAKPLPYFMKYASSYYGTLKKFSKSQTNMNRMCWEIEKWEKEKIRYKRTFNDFDYKIMTNSSDVDEEKLKKIEQIFLEFNKEISELTRDQYKFNNYKKYKQWINENYPTLDDEQIAGFTFDWNYYYQKYKNKCSDICPNQQELANIVVKICYEMYPKKTKKFIWKVASEGILKNIKEKNATVYLPSKNKDGIYTYLGKTYNMEKIDGGIEC